MNYSEAIQYIEYLALLEQQRPSLPSLKRMEAFLSYYDSPQNSFTSYHVAGTNGKGSTVAILDSILRQSNLKIGRYTGPHLLSINERFAFNGEHIADNDLARLVLNLKQKSEQFASSCSDMGSLSWFEFLTALSFFYFAEKNVDIAVFEVGLGGRFDATNVLTKLCATGITNISLDHQNILGNKIEDIAEEKAGIIKANIPIITAAREPALSVISKKANELNAKLINCAEKKLENSASYLKIMPLMKKMKNELCQHGLYQYQNALTAIAMLIESGIFDDSSAYCKKETTHNLISIDCIEKGIKNFYWPGRFQILESEQIILDCAHNPAGIKALRESLDYLYPDKNFHFIFGCYHDKDGLIMLSNLLRHGDHLYLADFIGKRAVFSSTKLGEHALALKVKVSSYEYMSKAVQAAKKQRQPDEYIVGHWIICFS